MSIGVAQSCIAFVAAFEREGKGDLRRVIVRISFLFHFERLPRRLQTGGVLPYKSLMGTCGQPGYVFRDFCLKQGIDFINFCLKQDKCLKQGIKNRNSFLNRVGKSAIFVLNRVRV